MERNFVIDTEYSEKVYNNGITPIKNDDIVTAFLNKNISLETLIENEIFKI